MTDLRTADCHNDLLLGVIHQRERGMHDPFGDVWLPQLRAGGVVVQVLPVFTEEQFVGEGALRRAILVLEEAWRLADMHSQDVAICLTGDDVRRTAGSGRIALVLALEGSEPIGNNLSVIDVFHRLGVRMVALSWNRRTMMADGVGEQDTGGRLTRLGVEAVAELERLRMVVDVSHLSEAGFWHIAEVASRPFIASHSSCRALHEHPRNLRDEQLRAVAERGGFVAINAFGAFLADDPTIASYLNHIRHAVEVVGHGHVALGPDFIHELAQTVEPVLGGALVDLDDLPWVEGLLGPGDLAPLWDCLLSAFGEDVADAVAWRTLTEGLCQLL